MFNVIIKRSTIPTYVLKLEEKTILKCLHIHFKYTGRMTRPGAFTIFTPNENINILCDQTQSVNTGVKILFYKNQIVVCPIFYTSNWQIQREKI